MTFRLVQAALAACLAGNAAAAAPADDPRSPLGLGDALARAASRHPALAGFVHERRGADAGVAAARQWLAPDLELTLEDAAGTGLYRGLDEAQATLRFSQLVRLGGQRDALTDAADARRDALLSEQAARQLDILAEVARRFVQVCGQQERLETLAAAGRIAAQSAETVGARVHAAAAPEADRVRARVAIAEARLRTEDAEHVLDTYRGHLAAAMGLEQPDFGEARGALFELPAPASVDALLARLRQSPDFLRFASEARLRDAQLNLARGQARGELRASLGVRRFESSGDTALVAGLNLPLLSGRRAAPALELAQAELERVPLKQQEHWNRARAQLSAHYLEMLHARHVEQTLRGEIVPALESALAHTEEAYRRGRYSYLQLAEIQRELLDARLRRIEAAEDFHINRIEIERLTGESLASAGDPS